MNPDQLRALADALFSGTHYVESPELHEAMMRAADYLRRCADAQPVAWRCEVRGDGTDPQLGAGDWRHYHTTTSKREPLSDEQIDAALQSDPAMVLALMSGEMTVGEFKAALRRLARTVEHAHGISGGGHD